MVNVLSVDSSLSVGFLVAQRYTGAGQPIQLTGIAAFSTNFIGQAHVGWDFFLWSCIIVIRKHLYEAAWMLRN